MKCFSPGEHGAVFSKLLNFLSHCPCPRDNFIQHLWKPHNVCNSMADDRSAAARSSNMSRIRGKDTKPEMLVRRFLHAQGLRYRLHDRRLPGSPDVVLPKYKAVVIVQGCFWHKHGEGCAIKARVPKSNLAFWESKLERNVQRDQLNESKLLEAGWRVFIIWECSLKKAVLEDNLNSLVKSIRDK
jgi:DNA mismatch endonuclease (patch repair protein)